MTSSTAANSRGARASFPFVLGLLASACASAPPRAPVPEAPVAPPAVARAWEHERSDLPVDPRIRFGRLDNGMRYAWVANAEPKDRCCLRLHVDVGSLAEEESERGMAHFLEHMAFNGTERFSGTSLIEWFQRHGMSFGPDTNAFTGLSETVYEIDLPRSDAASIGEALGVLRDFADGMLLDPREIEDEKGVIDAEERERDSPAQRILERSWEIELAGTRIPERIPIGTPQARGAFTSEAVRRFYRRWYQPENLTLILVGDLGDFDPSRLVESTFADLERSSEPPSREPPVGTPTFAKPFFSVPEKDVSTVTIVIERARPWQERADDLANVRRELPLAFARRMLDLRLHELSKQEGAPFLSARTFSLREDGLRAEDGEGLEIDCTSDRWEEALAACSLELRRALDLGFADGELAEVRADTLRNLEESVDRERTRSSRSWASELVFAAEERHVPIAAPDERAIQKPIVEGLDAKGCREAYAAAWGEGAWIVSVSGNVELGPEPERTVREAWEESLATPVEARAAVTDDPFAYGSESATPGAIASRKHDDEFDLEQVVFENGVRLHAKATDFQEKQILAYALIGEGELAIDPKERALAIAAPLVLVGGGLGKHDQDQVRRLTAGRAVGVGLSLGEEAFVLGGATTAEDLLLQCELMRAYLVDPGWREEGLRQLEKQVPVIFDSFEHQPQGPITREYLPELYSGDERMKFPERERFEALTTEDVKRWLTASLENAPVDLVFVGDLDVDATVEAVARTFGTLPPRRARDPHEDRRKPVTIATGLRRDYSIDTEVPKTFVLVSYPATDGRDAGTRRRLEFLARVLMDRLRVEVREKLGAAYSPSAGARTSETIPEDGWIGVQAMAEPAETEKLVEACLSIADAMAKEGLTAEEVDRQRNPARAEVRERLRTNSYWLDGLSALHADRDAFADLRSYPAFVDAIELEELNRLAKQYLGRERASVVTVAPKTKETTPTEPTVPKRD